MVIILTAQHIGIKSVYYKFEKITDETLIDTYKTAISNNSNMNDVIKITREDIENIAAYDIADGNSGISFFRSSDGGNKLRKWSTERDNGKTDKSLTHSEKFGDWSGSIDSKLASSDDSGTAQNYE